MPLARIDTHAVTGVVAPKTQEAMIREVWAQVTTSANLAALARRMIHSGFLAPVGILLLAPLWAKRLLGFLPGLSFLTVKYTVTNRRLMVRRGLKPVSGAEIPLSDIGELRFKADENLEYYQTADVEVVRKDGTVAFTMEGVPEPESFRQTVLQARDAWAIYL